MQNAWRLNNMHVNGHRTTQGKISKTSYNQITMKIKKIKMYRTQ